MVLFFLGRGKERQAVERHGGVETEVRHLQGVGVQVRIGRGENETQVPVGQLDGRNEVGERHETGCGGDGYFALPHAGGVGVYGCSRCCDGLDGEECGSGQWTVVEAFAADIDFVETADIT